MNSFFPMRRGDLYLISPTDYQYYLTKKKETDSLLLEDTAVYNVNGSHGSHAIRTLASMPLDLALEKAAVLLGKCRKLDLLLLSALIEEIAYGFKELNTKLIVGDFDDIIIALQPEQIKVTVEHLRAIGSNRADEIVNKFNDLTAGDGLDDYGYILNVAAHNVLQCWATWGDDESQTIIQNEFDEANINILVIHESVSDECLKETHIDPVIPSLELLIEDYAKKTSNTCLVHLSPELKERLAGVRFDTSMLENIEPSYIQEKIA